MAWPEQKETINRADAMVYVNLVIPVRDSKTGGRTSEDIPWLE
jgi:hypothetical protein